MHPPSKKKKNVIQDVLRKQKNSSYGSDTADTIIHSNLRRLAGIKNSPFLTKLS